MILIYLSLTLE